MDRDKNEIEVVKIDQNGDTTVASSFNSKLLFRTLFKII